MTPNDIKQTRLALGRTQAEFAEVLNTTKTTVSRWEQGLSSPMPVHRANIQKLIDYAAKNNLLKEEG